jgi:hypothetical protein
MASRILPVFFSSKFIVDRFVVGAGVGGILSGSYGGYHHYKNMNENDPYIIKYCLTMPANIIFGGAVGVVFGGVLFAASPIVIPCAIFGAVDNYRKLTKN